MWLGNFVTENMSSFTNFLNLSTLYHHKVEWINSHVFVEKCATFSSFVKSNLLATCVDIFAIFQVTHIHIIVSAIFIMMVHIIFQI